MQPNPNTWATALGLADLVPKKQSAIIRNLESMQDCRPQITERAEKRNRSGRRIVPQAEYERFNALCLRLLRKDYGNKRIIKIAMRLGMLRHCSHSTRQTAIQKVRAANGFFDKRVQENSIQHRVIQLKNKGLDAQAIAKILNIPETEVKWRITQQRYRTTGKSRTERAWEYVNLHNQGMNHYQIADKLGVTPDNVRNQIKRYKSLGYINDNKTQITKKNDTGTGANPERQLPGQNHARTGGTAE